MGVSRGRGTGTLGLWRDPDEIEELLYDPALMHELTGELLRAYD